MARRKNSIADILVELPWWVSVILAVIAYVALKYIIPPMIENPYLKGFALALPSMAPFIAGVLLFIAFISAIVAWRKGKLLDEQTGIESIRALSWRQFEVLVGETYRRQGYSVAETGGGADGGIDLILKRNEEVIFVQCKHWKMRKVGVKIIRELYGVMMAEGATGGIVILSGEFTREAESFSAGKPIELVPGHGLLRLVEEVKRNAEAPEARKHVDDTHTDKNSDTGQIPACPLCGNTMRLRIAKRGRYAGKKFWGCNQYPKCKGIVTL